MEVVIAAAILLIAALATAQFFSNSFKSMQLVNLLEARDRIGRRVENAINDPVSFFYSLHTVADNVCPDCNVQLKNCLEATGNCTDNAAGHPFVLFSAEGGDNQIRPLAGSAAGPVVYSLEGAKANFDDRVADVANAEDFPFEARAYFRPINIQNNVAESIAVQYQIIYRPPPSVGATTGNMMRRRTNAAGDSVFGSDDGSGRFVYPNWFNRGTWTNHFEVETREVNLARLNNCAPGEVLLGFRRSGAPICRCLGQRNSGGNCAAAFCENDDDNVDGDELTTSRRGLRRIEGARNAATLGTVCFAPMRLVCDNTFRTVETGGSCADEGGIYWISAIKFDECFADNTPAPKGGAPPPPSAPDCSSKEIKCCREVFPN